MPGAGPTVLSWVTSTVSWPVSHGSPEPAKAHAALSRPDTGSQHRAEPLERDGKCVRGIAREDGGLGEGKLSLL